MLRFRNGNFAALAVTLATTACGSPGAVSLLLFVDQPAVAVEDAALGSRLTGAFTLRVELGEYADEGVTVQLEAFELQDAQGPLASPLSLVGAPATLTLAPGGKQSVPVTFQQDALLGATERERVCSGALRIAGAVSDGAKTTSGRSGEVAAVCP